ncbi:MAG: Rab family GTPase [Nitrososphaerales archaeon]
MVSLSAKICLLGDYAVGKTSLVRRFVYNLFEDKYLSTIGVKVSRKVVAVPRGDDVIELVVMLWDLAGSEEFDSVRASYLRGAAGALLVCDVTQRATLDAISGYADQMRAVNPHAVIVLAGNKQDLAEQRMLSEDELVRVAAALRAGYFPTSAKTGAGVEEAFRHLGRLSIGA